MLLKAFFPSKDCRSGCRFFFFFFFAFVRKNCSPPPIFVQAFFFHPSIAFQVAHFFFAFVRKSCSPPAYFVICTLNGTTKSIFPSKRISVKLLENPETSSVFIQTAEILSFPGVRQDPKMTQSSLTHLFSGKKKRFCLPSCFQIIC